MKISIILGAIAAATAVYAVPTKTLNKRASMCGQWDSTTTGNYILYQDLWGESAASSGSQCSSLNCFAGNTIAWSTSWSWAGGSSSVKSYANAVVKMTSKELGSLTTIPTTWKWGYTGSSIVADVSYDSFLGTTPTGAASYEVMIWLAALGGAGPISSTGQPIAWPTFGGVSFSLYKGPNGATTVFSFVATSEQTNFRGDLMNFYEYLETNQGVSSSQYLQSIGAGTEPFT
ncbi:MAG: hypothetical protein M1827_006059 [Pycnora praestabilis]|nr:MAG: hypothetical protein M1827_006059 [Pycnora praestabilis]